MDDLPDFTTPEQRGRQAELEALLDWHHRADAGLARLLTRLKKPQRSPRLDVVRRLAAVAALLLVALALGIMYGPERVEAAPLVASLILPNDSRNVEIAKFSDAVPSPPDRQPARGMSERDLPRGPRVDLKIELRNAGNKDISLDVGGERTQLTLDLTGPGVRTLSGKAEAPPFLTKREVTLKPGETFHLDIPHLIGGRRGDLHGVYGTVPGRYTLRATYRVGLVGSSREVVVAAPATEFEVKGR